ncbi:hypothetical protein JXR01_03275 [Candidatus Kaiserbacteria bacterium]|nr:MAG: hypothetical protein JXR01_03275 [Candidatus Kaiserbacteria bacterium]
MHYKTDSTWLIEECSKTDSFGELVVIAIAELEKFENGAEVVCGPISTGGKGSLEANFKVFSETITKLQKDGCPIFSQVPYEERIFFFRNRWLESDPTNKGKYYMPILEEFYHPLLQTGLIKKGWFIPGWDSSFGARWEREQLTEGNAEIEDLTEAWVDEIFS